MYSFFTDPALVKRKTIDAPTGHTSEETIGTFPGYLKAQSMQEVAQGNGSFWNDYNFTCRGATDIKAGDILTIRGVKYSVKSVGRKRAISLDTLVCKISKLNANQ